MGIYNGTERRLPNYLCIFHVSLEFHFTFIKVEHSAGNQIICAFIAIISNIMLNKTERISVISIVCVVYQLGTQIEFFTNDSLYKKVVCNVNTGDLKDALPLCEIFSMR
jgi:hypothetical protein